MIVVILLNMLNLAKWISYVAPNITLLFLYTVLVVIPSLIFPSIWLEITKLPSSYPIPSD